MQIFSLNHRGILAVTGEDATSFLQGLISNDIHHAAPDRLIYSAMLTPQGKFLHEFFILKILDGYWLEAERERLPDLKQRLEMYKLRSKVAIQTIDDHDVYFVKGGTSDCGLEDPRLPHMGHRLYATSAPETLSSFDEYQDYRLSLGLPEGSWDLEASQAILLENGFDELGAIDWKKGCYVGQELTARTRYRALIKKRLLKVSTQGFLPHAGTILMTEQGQEAGVMKSSSGHLGLALIRLEFLGTPIHGLTVTLPDWIKIPQE